MTQSFLISALGGTESLTSRHSRLPQRKNAGTREIGGYVDHMAGLDIFGTRKFYAPTGNPTPVLESHNSYIDCRIAAPSVQ